jgi:hypothetical protein
MDLPSEGFCQLTKGQQTQEWIYSTSTQEETDPNSPYHTPSGVYQGSEEAANQKTEERRNAGQESQRQLDMTVTTGCPAPRNT